MPKGNTKCKQIHFCALPKSTCVEFYNGEFVNQKRQLLHTCTTHIPHPTALYHNIKRNVLVWHIPHQAQGLHHAGAASRRLQISYHDHAEREQTRIVCHTNQPSPLCLQKHKAQGVNPHATLLLSVTSSSSKRVATGATVCHGCFDTVG